MLNEQRRKVQLAHQKGHYIIVTLGSFSDDYGEGKENGKK